MELSLSTHWNAHAHSTGEGMIDEILSLGFRRVELGYDLTLDLVPGVLQRVKDNSVSVSSLHNFCPVPVGIPRAHPELFDFSSLDEKIREAAVRHTTRSLEFAAEVGARTVVAHAGNVDMKHLTADLISLCEEGQQYSSKFDRIKMKLMTQRDEKATRQLEKWHRSIEALLPVCERTGVRIAFENLPSWEAIPTETEMEALLQKYQSPWLCCWHDIGHGQIRQNLGFISVKRWFERLSPRLAGLHVHDVSSVARDHLMPPRGKVDFQVFKPFLKSDMALVVEPAPGTPSGEVLAGRQFITEAWQLTTP